MAASGDAARETAIRAEKREKLRFMIGFLT
jgi:hypothetical protein